MTIISNLGRKCSIVDFRWLDLSLNRADAEIPCAHHLIYAEPQFIHTGFLIFLSNLKAWCLDGLFFLFSFDAVRRACGTRYVSDPFLSLGTLAFAAMSCALYKGTCLNSSHATPFWM
jgi:hypothetical protein